MANPMPAAEFEVTADLVRRLLARQHPDLAGLPVEPFANGWDNTLFRLGDGLVVRLPRRALGASVLLNEQRWLPSLAPRLPLPVPVPVRTGVPGEGYPWPWSVVRFLPGIPASDGPAFDPRQAAADLGRFFGALHVAAPPNAPANPVRGVPLAQRAANLEQNLAAVAGQVDRDAVLAAWNAALAVPGWDGPPVWLHGDPHPANILVREGRVSGVLDFGDITAGDPASDLSLAWMLLPASCHDPFRAAYAKAGDGPVSDATWARGRGWALNLAIVFLAWSADNPRLHAVGRRTLAVVLAALPGTAPAVAAPARRASTSRSPGDPPARSAAGQANYPRAVTGASALVPGFSGCPRSSARIPRSRACA
jgi:aminoglycoside phosphotransferase (APT) family kinase protein